MEAFMKLMGMCITFIPSVYFASYMIKKATSEQRFDFHLKRVKDKAGLYGILMAIYNRVILFFLTTILGMYITTCFTNSIYLDVLIVLFIMYIISYFFDNKNDI